MNDRGVSLRTRLSWLVLATLGLAASAQADPHRPHPIVTPAPPGPARDGISGSSMGRAHAGLGGPATTKPATWAASISNSTTECRRGISASFQHRRSGTDIAQPFGFC